MDRRVLSAQSHATERWYRCLISGRLCVSTVNLHCLGHVDFMQHAGQNSFVKERPNNQTKVSLLKIETPYSLQFCLCWHASYSRQSPKRNNRPKTAATATARPRMLTCLI